MIRTAILACSIVAGGVLGGGTAGLVGRLVAPTQTQETTSEREIASLLQKISLQIEPVARLANATSNTQSQRQNDIDAVLKSMPTK